MELRPKFATSKDIKTSDTNLFKTNKSDVKKNNNNEQIEKTKNNLVKQNKTHASDKLSEQVSNIIKGIGIILPKNFNDTKQIKQIKPIAYDDGNNTNNLYEIY